MVLRNEVFVLALETFGPRLNLCFLCMCRVLIPRTSVWNLQAHERFGGKKMMSDAIWDGTSLPRLNCNIRQKKTLSR